jgi:hypothetical protein
MPINYPSLRPLRPDETGGLAGIDLTGSILKGLNTSNAFQEARYRPQQLEEDLRAKKLANQINEAKARFAEKKEAAGIKQMEAQINHLAAQTALSQGNLGLIPYYKKLYSAQAQAQLANAQKSSALSGLYNDVLQGTNQSNENNSNLSYKEGKGMPLYGSRLNNETRAFNNIRNDPNMNKANLIAGLLHLPVSSQVVNGQLVTNNPLSGITSTKVGPTAEETAFATGMGKGKAEEYNTAITTYNALENQGLALNELINAANNSEFRNVTGKINQPLTNWFGTPEQQQLLGQLQTSSGEIALQIAPSLKGAWTGRDQAMVNSIKASPNDFPDVFIGKLKAQSLINNALKERAQLKANYLEQGFSTLEASRLAAKETPLERFKPEIERLIKHKQLLTPSLLKKAREELARRESRG